MALFVQAMLAKVSSTIIDGYESDTFLFDKSNDRYEPTKTNNEWIYKINTYTQRDSIFSGSISLITIANSLGAVTISGISVYINDTAIISNISLAPSQYNTTENFNFSVPANTDLKVKVTAPGYTSGYENPIFVCLKKLSLTGKITHQLYKKGEIVGKPRVLKDITQKATTTIFGVHIDNTRITQDAE